ncbi:hypothetical protein ACFSM5_15560 [Lacibacterium aquatile]|uniref:PAS domain-containing protein n=1 Tax=Lacibacterium aquatile TaxID=1168082 RepID=A0ABW5DTZ9_9PROT
MRVAAGGGSFFWDEELSLTTLDSVVDRSLVDTLAAWQNLQKATGRAVPSRKQFFPETVPGARGRLSLWMVIAPEDGKGLDFEMIVQSSRTMMLYRLQPGRITVGNLSNDGYRELMMAHFGHVCEQRVPLATRIHLEREGHPTVFYDRLAVPFSEDGASINYLLTCADFSVETANAIRDTVPDFNQQSPGWSQKGS